MFRHAACHNTNKTDLYGGLLRPSWLYSKNMPYHKKTYLMSNLTSQFPYTFYTFYKTAFYSLLCPCLLLFLSPPSLSLSLPSPLSSHHGGCPWGAEAVDEELHMDGGGDVRWRQAGRG